MKKSIIALALGLLGLIGAVRAAQPATQAPADCCPDGPCCGPGAACCATR